MSLFSRHTSNYETDPIKGFTVSQLSNPEIVGFLCSAGLDIADLDVAKVISTTDGQKVREYISKIVSTVAGIETATKKDAPDEVKHAAAEQYNGVMQIVNNGFAVLETSPTRSVAIDVPYIDIHGNNKTLVAVANTNPQGAIAAGLYTESAASYSQ